MITNAQLHAMDINALRELNKNVVAIIKARQTKLAAAAATQFYPGQSVTFTGRYGNTIKGVVTKIKIKMISVDAGQQGRWNVAATLLKAD
jgi:hypothetical protein